MMQVIYPKKKKKRQTSSHSSFSSVKICNIYVLCRCKQNIFWFWPDFLNNKIWSKVWMFVILIRITGYHKILEASSVSVIQITDPVRCQQSLT